MLHTSLSSTAHCDLLQPCQHLHEIRGNRQEMSSRRAKVTRDGNATLKKIQMGIMAPLSLGEGHLGERPLAKQWPQAEHLGSSFKQQRLPETPLCCQGLAKL